METTHDELLTLERLAAVLGIKRMETMHDELLTPERLAAVLGIKKTTLYSYKRTIKDFPPAIKIMGTYLWSRSDIEDFLERHKEKKGE